MSSTYTFSIKLINNLHTHISSVSYTHSPRQASTSLRSALAGAVPQHLLHRRLLPHGVAPAAQVLLEPPDDACPATVGQRPPAAELTPQCRRNPEPSFFVTCGPEGSGRQRADNTA